MRNIALFVVLAVLTVAALVAWNVTIRKTSPQPVANVQPTPSESVTTTPETGGALRRIFNGGLFSGGNTTPTPVPTTGFSPTSTPIPTVTVGPTPVGGYTKGGLPVSTPATTTMPTPTVSMRSLTQPTVAQTPTPTAAPQAANVVSFADNGFTPNTLTVSNGTVVRFVNNSNQQMWIIADNSTFDMGQSVSRNGSYEYRFTSTGEWWYHNKLNQNQKGKIVVN